MVVKFATIKTAKHVKNKLRNIKPIMSRKTLKISKNGLLRNSKNQHQNQKYPTFLMDLRLSWKRDILQMLKLEFRKRIKNVIWGIWESFRFHLLFWVKATGNQVFIGRRRRSKRGIIWWDKLNNRLFNIKESIP